MGEQALNFLRQHGRLLYETFAEPPTSNQGYSSGPRSGGTSPLGQPPNMFGAAPSHPSGQILPPISPQEQAFDWIPARTQSGMILAHRRPDEQLERYEWRVLALVDGQRRARDIASVLRWHPGQVVQVLQQLQKKNLIS